MQGRNERARLHLRAGTSLVILAATASLGLGAAARAQTVPVETIVVNGTRANDAADIAPGSTPLTAVEPTTTVSGDFIQRNLPLSGNYDEAIKFTPGVFDTAPNGPGLAESQNISIRGFQDGQFNVTFDGIPWGDSNDFTHHTTSYFMAHDLGEITVDRGPGTGATIGNATFGGTVYILSKAPDDHFNVQPYLSYGSFTTADAGVEVNTGKLNASGTRLFVDGEVLRSDGYLTNESQHRQNIYAKLVQPIGSNFTLTIVGMYNHVHQNISLGATRAEIETLGPDWGLTKNPNLQNYYKYNADFIKTDIEYGDLAGSFDDGWSIDAKLYSYSYNHTGFNGKDPNGDYPNLVALSPGGALTAGVPGEHLINNYRSVGTIVRITKTVPFGDIQTGLWYDHQDNRRGLFEIVMDQGKARNYDDGGDADLNDPGTGAVNGVARDLNQTLQTLQPYFQVNVTPLKGLTLTPGVRYSWFDRNVVAAVNVKTAAPQIYDNVFHSWLPSFEARYEISPQWMAYGQVAKGFLAPNENFFNQNDPNSTTLKPETTWNYQAGTTWQSRALSLTFDGYIIDFSNLIVPVGTRGGLPIFGNIGGSEYRGLEAEGTLKLTHALSLYANASIASALSNADKSWVPNTPKSTAAGGLIYSHGGIYASILAKWIGPRYGDTQDTQHLSGFATADVSLGLDLGRVIPEMDGSTLKINVQNITNNTMIVNLAGYTAGSAGTPLFWTQPGRSVFASLQFKL